MNGMNAKTGAALDGVAHLEQSVGDILSTPLGTRVGRREYGSLLPELVDQAMNRAGRMRLLAATALAILRWEPRIRLTNVAINQTDPAAFALTLEGTRTDAVRNSRATLSIPLPTTGTKKA